MNKSDVDGYLGKEVVVNFSGKPTLQGTLYSTDDPMFDDHPILSTIHKGYVLLPSYHTFKAYMAYTMWEANNPPQPKPRGKCPDKDTLYDMYINQCMTLAAIGKEFGVSRERVRQWVKVNGINSRPNGALTTRKIDAVSREELVADVESNMTRGQLSDKYNIPLNRVGKLLDKHGLSDVQKQHMVQNIKSAHTKPIPVDKDTLTYLYETTTTESICAAYGIHLPTLYRWLNRYGIQKKGYNPSSHLSRQVKEFPYDAEEFARDYNSMRVDECAKKYHMSSMTMYSWLHKLGIPTKQHHSL